MSETTDLTKFREKIQQRRSQATPQPTTQTIVFDDDLIPGTDEAPSPNSDPELDRAIDGISIVDAYRKWCGKSSPNPSDARREGIKVSCPIPNHPDRNPSAWLNTEKNVWYCASCSVGGDAYDLAAYHFGYSVPEYKTGTSFHELRRKMAEGFGYKFVQAPGMPKPVMVGPAPEPQAQPAAASRPVVVQMVRDDDKDDTTLPTLDWERLVEEDTFLHRYMEACTRDDLPEAYHFWNAMLAIGMALGRDVTLFDKKPVLGNIFLCLLGPTGDGKSQSFWHLQQLLWKALPYKYDDPNSKGTAFISSPASAEHLIHQFMKPVTDPNNPKIVAYYAPVRGLIEFNELSSLVGRASRKGNVLKPTLMEFYDGQQVVSTGSMTSGLKRAEQPFGSCFTTTQPLALKDLVRESDAHSGFLNRWVFATATPKKRVAVGGEMIDITPSVDPLKAIQGWAGFGKQIQWGQPALDMFSDYFHGVLHPAQQADETGLLTRMDLLAKKLILLLSANSHDNEVQVKTVDRVISMFSYLTAAYGVPAAHIGSTISTEIRDELVRHITRYTDKKGGISLRELNKAIKRKNYPLDLVSKTLKYLTELQVIEVEATAGVGRPTVKYKLCS